MNKNYKRGFIAEMFVILVALFILFIIVIQFTGLHIQTAQGEHTGIVTATETSGLIFKTHTVYIKTNSQSSQEDTYCVIGDDVYSKLQELQTTNSSTTVKFIDYVSAGIANCNNESAGIIIGVK